jgi:hypothetical protein
MTQLDKFIKFLEDRIDALHDDFQQNSDNCAKGRMDELKFILRYVPVSQAEIAEAGTEKLKPTEWIERVRNAWGSVLVRPPIIDNATGVVTAYMVEVGGMQRLIIALDTPVDWSEDE